VWEGSLFVGSYGTGLLHRITLPATPGSAVDDVVARFDHGITDVEAGPDGALYVSTSDAIWRIEGDAASMSPIPVPSASAAPAPPAGPDDGRSLTIGLLATAAAVAAAAGLAMRFAAGRRLRRLHASDEDGGDPGPG
jgi:hypothetical protein